MHHSSWWAEIARFPLQRWHKVALVGSMWVALTAVSAKAPVVPGSDSQALVREVIANEVRAESNDHSFWSYREVTQRDGKKLLFEFVETHDGAIHRLLAVNGEPLNQRARQAETARIQRLITSPQAVRAAQRKDEEDAQKERDFLKLFPDVFRYREQQRQDENVALAFAPNPNYNPSGYMAEVLHCLEGSMVVNVRQKRLVSINGRLTREVKFWGGLLGHVDAGGRFSVTMLNVAPGYWELKSLHVNMHGKVLLFKTITAHENNEYSEYRPMPPGTTPVQAAELLEKNSHF